MTVCERGAKVCTYKDGRRAHSRTRCVARFDGLHRAGQGAGAGAGGGETGGWWHTPGEPSEMFFSFFLFFKKKKVFFLNENAKTRCLLSMPRPGDVLLCTLTRNRRFFSVECVSQKRSNLFYTRKCCALRRFVPAVASPDGDVLLLLFFFKSKLFRFRERGTAFFSWRDPGGDFIFIFFDHNLTVEVRAHHLSRFCSNSSKFPKPYGTSPN